MGPRNTTNPSGLVDDPSSTKKMRKLFNGYNHRIRTNLKLFDDVVEDEIQELVKTLEDTSDCSQY